MMRRALKLSALTAMLFAAGHAASDPSSNGTGAPVDRIGAFLENIASPSFRSEAGADDLLARQLGKQFGNLERSISTASLYDLSHDAEELRGLPSVPNRKALPKMSALLAAVIPHALSHIEMRVTALKGTALAALAAMGSSYRDAESILRSGAAVAQEFEDAGYEEEGSAVLARAVARTDQVLKEGLPRYRQELAALSLTLDEATALKKRADTFASLSMDMAGFGPYERVTREYLAARDGAICALAAKNVKMGWFAREEKILTGEAAVPMSRLACDLYRNGHRLIGMSRLWWPWQRGAYRMEIAEANGATVTFTMNRGESAKSGPYLTGIERTGASNPAFSAAQWKDTIGALVRRPVSPPSGKPDKDGATECDRLAADPDDPKKRAPGRDWSGPKIDPALMDRALDACIASVEYAPKDITQNFQLGRMLWLAGDEANAAEYFDLAAKAGYPPALHHAAETLIATSQDNNTFIDALELYEKATRAGYRPAARTLKELNPEGIKFFREIPPPSGGDIARANSARNITTAVGGIQASARYTGAVIHNCFQTSATDFACEYRPVVQCGTNLGGLYNMLFALACRRPDEAFGSFRKMPSGAWREIAVE